MSRIRRLLVANRGEIACRIFRTAEARGIETIAVFSDADRQAAHVRLADRAVHIGGAAPADSYLNIDAILTAARKTGADAIHPGYGFLSERADFARACAEAGVLFVGPGPDAIAAMGDKATAKQRMMDAGVPCVPGYQGADQSAERFAAEAEAIGYPVMVKASAGGGGRGMRRVERAEDLADAVASARREAESAFGDGRLLLEKAVIDARHVEIQILADAHGTTLHLGERDCSLQRRNQKVIEEAPSPVIDDPLREAMGAAAVRAAQAVDYVNAGTVEFLFDPAARAFYFLEMNTRLQVEHPVTEEVTALDLVALQLNIAEGRPLGLSQDAIALDGWAMEARLYAEDPAQGFQPQTGQILDLSWPRQDLARIDEGIGWRDTVSPFYDPMLAKIVARGETREAAREALIAALRETRIEGLTTNRAFLIDLLQDPAFVEGAANTTHIDRRPPAAPPAETPPLPALALAALLTCDHPGEDPLFGFHSRGAAELPLILQAGDRQWRPMLTLTGRAFRLSLEDQSLDGHLLDLERYDEGGFVHWSLDGVESRHDLARDGDRVAVTWQGVSYVFEEVSRQARAGSEAGGDQIRAPMAGRVTAVAAQAGDAVTKGQVLLTLEAMKMEHPLKAPRDGVIAALKVAEGDQVALRDTLVDLSPED